MIDILAYAELRPDGRPLDEEFDRLWEQTPADERGPFPFSFSISSSPLSPAGIARGQHSAAVSDDPLLQGTAAHVPTTNFDA